MNVTTSKLKRLSKKQELELLLATWKDAAAKAKAPVQTPWTPGDVHAHHQHCLACVAHLEEAIELLSKKAAGDPMGGGQQVVATPRPFVEYLCRKLGVHIGIDLAATIENTLRPDFFGPCPFSLASDALTQDWAACTGPSWWGWNNPEFGYVLPWVRKARVDSARGARVIQLLRMSLGTKWYNEEIEGQNCCVYRMKGRMTFPQYGHSSNFDTMIVVWDGLPWRSLPLDWRAEMIEWGFEC
jgi:hypothetical protein